MDDKLEPTVRYLLALGPKYTPLVFQTSEWVFDQDFDHAMQVRRSLCASVLKLEHVVTRLSVVDLFIRS